jgi:transposase-like protein
MSKSFTVSDVARTFGITPSQVFRDLQSWPYQGTTAIDIRFTEKDVAKIGRLMNAGPDTQMRRLVRLEANRAAVRAMDELAA